ncbi:MAG: hypothetical protein JO222_14495, partial [Frankiales bacterium]|nr:hypothetical protein [Frankiales bacterium]
MSGSARPRLAVVTVGYAAALGAAHLWLVAQPVADRRRILADSSTDVWHLGRDPWRVLPESALWAQHYAWLWV